jgi:predicted amino acid dehydrogenase
MRAVAIYHIFNIRSTIVSTQSITPIADIRTGNGAFELGLYSFAELTPDPATGTMVSPAQRLHNLIETIELADQVGLDVFGLGEHHRPDLVSSAPVGRGSWLPSG